jgi:hypothetical protein
VCSGALNWNTLNPGCGAACLIATGREGSMRIIRPTDVCRCVPICLTSSPITSHTAASLRVRSLPRWATIAPIRARSALGPAT